MSITSTIDWNEIVKLLPKDKREALYLEAVMILSQDQDQPKRTRRGVVKANPKMRYWRDSKDNNGNLSQIGRTYKLNRGISKKPGGVIGDVWTELLGKKFDTFSYSEFVHLCKGLKVQPSKISACLGYLWSLNFIDVVNP